MARNAFLTPETLTGDPLCYQLSLPVRLFEFILGALLPLGDVDNWEQEGSVTPFEAADYFNELLYNLLSKGCPAMQRAKVYKDADFTLSHNVAVDIPWSDAEYDTGFTFEEGEINLYAPETGGYAVNAEVQFGANSAAGIRQIQIMVGGVVRSIKRVNSLGAIEIFQLSWQGEISLGTSIRLRVFQTSAGSASLAVSASTRPTPVLSIVRLW